MRARFVLIAALLAAGLGACGDSDEAAPPPTLVGLEEGSDPTTTSSAPEDEAPLEAGKIGAGKDAVVTVVDTGAEPRQELRLRPQEGAVQPVTLRTVIDQTISMGGVTQDAPSAPVEYDVTYTVEAVDDDQIRVSLVYEAARVESAPGLPPDAVAQVQAMADGFVGTRVAQVYDHRMRLLAVEAPDGFGSAAGAIGEQMGADVVNQARALSMPFPEEPVGPGAVWEVRSDAAMSGMPMEIVTVVELTEVTATEVVARADQTLRFVPGEIETFGVTAEVLGGELSGSATLRWPLAVPAVLGEQTAEGTVRMAAEQNGQRVEMEIHQRQQFAYLPR